MTGVKTLVKRFFSDRLLALADKQNSSNGFIDFMLDVILETLTNT